MSTKQRKTTITTTTTRSSTHGGEEGASTSFSSSSASRRSYGSRPPSPARLSRQQEQEELQSLNNRLAAYIDKVRHLELENSRLGMLVKSSEEVVKREVTSVKTLYESELAELRKLLDDTAKEKARIQIECNKYKADYEDLLAKYNKRDRDAEALERRVHLLEAQLQDYKGKKLEKENQELRAELAALEKQLATAKQQLEEETLLRVDLENRIKTLKEDLHFKSQVYEQELEESRVRVSTQLEEVDGRIEMEYEAKLADALKEIRAQHDYDLQCVKVELETLYDNKIEDLKLQADRNKSSSSAAWDELRITRKSMEELQAEIARLKSENAGYELRCQDLEQQVHREREECRIQLRQRDEEVTSLREQLETLELDYTALLEIKIKLDREIEAYRKLLESEETRLNLSSESMSETSQVRTTTSGRGTKRRKVDIGQAVEEYSQRSSSSGYSRSGSGSSGISIIDVDPDGKFIKLTNTTSKEIHLGGWSLKHTAGEEETVFKFHRTLIVKPGATVTVWSSDSSTTHNPPNDLVMKGKRWFISDDMTTTLIDSDDREMATCTMSKSMRTSTSFSQRRTGLRGDGSEEFEDKDKCFVM